MFTAKNIRSSNALGAVAIAVVFFFVGTWYGESSLSHTSDGSHPQVSGMPSPSPDGLLHVVVGTIAAVDTNGITVREILPGANQPALITVGIDRSTVITQQIPIDAQVFQKEMQFFQAQLSTRAASTSGVLATPPVPPKPYTSNPITPADLSKGMFVTITPVAHTKEGATAFQAESISALKVSTSSSPVLLPPASSVVR